jgi:ectoine hydroxylase-related dioxygenase (phytanoyl-CoA dioxygenase family)
VLNTSDLQAEAIDFWRNGFVVVRGMFTRGEMAIVKQKILEINEMNARVELLRARQAQGEHPSFETVFVWNDVEGADIFAKIGRSYKILDRLSHYYDDDVYDYHNKITLKYHGIVGFRAHQDHAYWRRYGCRFPEAHAVFISIDAATLENGCLRIVPRSHHLGTLPHGIWTGKGSDNGVLPEVLRELLDGGYEFMPIETEPGDAVLFHGNTIHGSDDNNSDQSRIAMIATMNTKRNSPDPRFNKPGHPYWSHQTRVIHPITEADLELPLPHFDMRYDAETPSQDNHGDRVKRAG